jgi:hypothetical protein
MNFYVIADYVKCNGKTEKAFEYLTKVAVESIAPTHFQADYDSCLAFVEYAGEYAGNLSDVHSLVGVLALAANKHRSVRAVTHTRPFA